MVWKFPQKYLAAKMSHAPTIIYLINFRFFLNFDPLGSWLFFEYVSFLKNEQTEHAEAYSGSLVDFPLPDHGWKIHKNYGRQNVWGPDSHLSYKLSFFPQLRPLGLFAPSFIRVFNKK